MVGELVSRSEIVTAIDYHQLWLSGWSIEEPGVGIQELSARALRSPDRVAGDGWSLVVVSPHRHNFAAHIRVEVWTDVPADDQADWQEVVEGGVVIEDDQLSVDSPTVGAVRVPVPAGYYTARVSARGFIISGEPPTTKPGDVWRVQLWPANRTRRLRSWSAPRS